MNSNNGENSLFYKRTLASKVLEVSNSFPVVLITGPRQCGKTTLFKQCMDFESEKNGRAYVTLDDIKLRNFARSDPELFLQTYKFPILIDEVQYAPELFPYIKIIADRENKTGLFWLTGSQQFSLMKNVSESLAGRVGILQLQCFSECEIERVPNTKKFTVPFAESDIKSRISAHQNFSIDDLYNRIFRGSYPALYSRPQTETGIFYSSYVQTYLERDVKSILSLSDVYSFYEFMCVLAARTGQLLNYSEVSRDVGVSVNTVKKWVSVLESAGIIYLLQPWSSNVTNRVIKTPKLYFLDTGLCCYLTQWQSANALMNGIMSGAIFETFIISEIYKSWIHNGETPHFYFYRDKEQHEIDLILLYDGEVHPIEIKRSANPELSMAKSFSYLEKAGADVGPGAIVCLYNNFLPLNRTIVSVPWQAI